MKCGFCVKTCDFRIKKCLYHFDVSQKSQELTEDGKDKCQNISELRLRSVGK